MTGLIQSGANNRCSTMTSTSRSPYRNISWMLLALLCTLGAATPFLSFVFNTAPFDTLSPRRDELWKLGCPFLAATLVAAASMRLLWFGTMSLIERIIAFGTGAAILVITLSLITPLTFDRSGDMRTLIAVRCALAAALVGIGLVAKNAWAGVQRPAIALTTLQIAFIPNALMCLLLFLGEWEIGANVSALGGLLCLADYRDFHASEVPKALGRRGGVFRRS